jgi:adenylate cyclase
LGFLKRSAEKFKLTPAAVALTVTLLMLGLCVFGGEKLEFFQILEMKALDLRFKIRGVKAPAEDVVIVAIDDTSMAYYGSWPWPRAIHAQLVSLLKADGAKAVGFDVLFTLDQESKVRDQLKRLQLYYRLLAGPQKLKQKDKFAAYLSDTIAKTDYDGLMSRVFAQSNNIVLPMVFGDFGHPADAPLDENVASLANRSKTENPIDFPALAASVFETVSLAQGASNFMVPRARTLSLPLPMFGASARALGALNVFFDADSGLRWSNMVFGYKGKYFQTFDIQLLKLFKDMANKEVRLIQGRGIGFGDTLIPLDEQGRLLINYYGPAETFPYYPYAAVIEKTLAPQTFKDKIVIVGYSATGLMDIMTTPFSEAMPGVEKHATVISNILQNDFLKRNRAVFWLDLIFLFLSGLAVGLAASRFSALKAATVATGGLLAVLAINYALFYWGHLWVNLIWPVLTVLAVSASVTTFKFFIEETDKRFFKKSFESYLSPDVIDEMVQSKTFPTLGGEQRNISAYFTDIRSFTTLAEKLTAVQLVELLNDYLSAMTDILLENKGTLDKYEGDAIIAFFGAPHKIEDHALRACRTAIAMQKKLISLRRKWDQERQTPGEPERNVKNFGPDIWAPGRRWPNMVSETVMRIGINTGDIVVGNLGSATRMDYTMIGDAVNLAARLEQVCKQYGVGILASEATLNARFTDEKGETRTVAEMLEVRFIDTIIVVGQSRPVKVYEILAEKGGLDSDGKRLIETFDAAIDNYLNMQWERALAGFTESAGLERVSSGELSPSKVFVNRCQTYQKEPPAFDGAKWDGVSRLTKK